MTVQNLLRPEQVEAQKSDLQRMERMWEQPHIQDRGELRRQIQGVKRMLDAGTPTAFKYNEIDAAVKRAEQLKAEMLEGMPTQAEMRRAPVGAVSKHRAWEAKNKGKLLEWKHLQLRINAGTDDNDVANFERYRPAGGSADGDLGDALIPKTQVIHIPVNSAHAVTMSEEQSDVLKGVDPELHARMALLPASDRAKVLALVDNLIKAEQAEEPKPRGRPKKED